MALQNIQPFIFVKNCQTPDTPARHASQAPAISQYHYKSTADYYYDTIASDT